PSTRSWSPTASMLAVAASARAPAAILADEDTVSRGLGTPPLPEAHFPVGYRWQNSRCCQPLRGRSTATSTTSCRTRTTKVSSRGRGVTLGLRKNCEGAPVCCSAWFGPYPVWNLPHALHGQGLSALAHHNKPEPAVQAQRRVVRRHAQRNRSMPLICGSQQVL